MAEAEYTETDNLLPTEQNETEEIGINNLNFSHPNEGNQMPEAVLNIGSPRPHAYVAIAMNVPSENSSSTEDNEKSDKVAESNNTQTDNLLQAEQNEEEDAEINNLNLSHTNEENEIPEAAINIDSSRPHAYVAIPMNAPSSDSSFSDDTETTHGEFYPNEPSSELAKIDWQDKNKSPEKTASSLLHDRQPLTSSPNPESPMNQDSGAIPKVRTRRDRASERYRTALVSEDFGKLSHIKYSRLSEDTETSVISHESNQSAHKEKTSQSRSNPQNNSQIAGKLGLDQDKSDSSDTPPLPPKRQHTQRNDFPPPPFITEYEIAESRIKNNWECHSSSNIPLSEGAESSLALIDDFINNASIYSYLQNRQMFPTIATPSDEEVYRERAFRLYYLIANDINTKQNSNNSPNDASDSPDQISNNTNERPPSNSRSVPEEFLDLFLSLESACKLILFVLFSIGFMLYLGSGVYYGRNFQLGQLIARMQMQNMTTVVEHLCLTPNYEEICGYSFIVCGFMISFLQLVNRLLHGKGKNKKYLDIVCHLLFTLMSICNLKFIFERMPQQDYVAEYFRNHPGNIGFILINLFVCLLLIATFNNGFILKIFSSRH